MSLQQEFERALRVQSACKREGRDPQTREEVWADAIIDMLSVGPEHCLLETTYQQVIRDRRSNA